MNDAAATLERAYREEWSTVLATVARRMRDLELAEEATADAFAAAAARWPAEGVPQRPGAWLMTSAWRRALDLHRRARTRDRMLDAAAAETRREDAMRTDAFDLPESGAAESDDRLALIFACCHPALSIEAQVALTLRCIIGLPTEAIARSFLSRDTTMAQRLLRAKQKMRASGIPIEVPPPAAWPERVEGVRAVVYLVLTTGYDHPETDLTEEGVWLAGLLHRLLPLDGEVTGLLALGLLHQARTASRWTTDGRPIRLAEQDRSRWDHGSITRAGALIAGALARGRPGPYQVEAAIAALHGQARRADDTDWPQIAALYGVLVRLAPSAVVELNRAVAVAMADGAPAGLAVLRPLLGEPALQDYAPLHAAHAHLLELSGDAGAAREAWQRAAEHARHAGTAAAIRERHL